MEDTDERAEKKRLAVEYAVKKLMTEMMEDAAQTQNTNQVIYESDSEDSYMQDTVPISAGATATATANATNLAYPRSTIEKFIDSLRYNLIFNVGFDVNGIHPDDEKSCVCPCSKTMSRWRDNFGVNHMESKDKCNYHKKAVPKGLMDHLHKTGKQGGFLHRGIELYLTKMYEDHLVHIGHKALYNIGDDMYKKAEAEERRLKFK
jgi:Zn ribbon nucleic-acid-binding protein